MAGQGETPGIPFVGIMAKAPRAGHAKTRLTRALTPEIAADLYRHFLLDTIEVVRRVHHVAPALLCPSGDGPDLRRLDPALTVVEQPEPGLMQGLAFGIEHALALGHPMALLINADSPTLPPERIREAIAMLATHDVVLGPTTDGGYYLIAATVPCAHLLCAAPYLNGATICAETLTCARRLGLRADLIAPWFDVDLPVELQRLMRALRDQPAQVAAHTRRALACHEAALRELADDGAGI
jgi:rSAM/selenodomain-associated transferase 1